MISSHSANGSLPLWGKDLCSNKQQDAGMQHWGWNVQSYEIRMQKYDKELLQMYLKGKKLHALHLLKPFLTALTWYSFRCYGDCYPVIYTFKENISILSHEILSVRNPSLMQYRDYYLNRPIRHSFS